MNEDRRKKTIIVNINQRVSPVTKMLAEHLREDIVPVFANRVIKNAVKVGIDNTLET